MKILVIEDDIKIANSLKKGLEMEMFAVDVCYDGECGLDMALTEDYNIIVLDLMLPKVSGLDICTKIRKNNISVPILMLTAMSEIDDKVSGFEMGADDYLTKPFAFDELVARIKALLRRPKNIAPQIFEVGSLKLDVQQKTISFNRKLLELSKKEFMLLEMLIKNKGKVLSKDKLIQNVWDFESDVMPNTVEVFIASLRSKLGKAGCNYIKTVRGFGYKLEPQ